MKTRWLFVIVLLIGNLHAADWREIEAQRRLEADRARRAREAALQADSVRKEAVTTTTPAQWKATWQRQQQRNMAIVEAQQAAQADQTAIEEKAKADMAAAKIKKSDDDKSRLRFIISTVFIVALFGWLAGWIIRSCKYQPPAKVRISIAGMK